MSSMFLLGIQGSLPCFKVVLLLQAAQHAQKQSTELFQCMYFKDKDQENEERCVSEGVIYSIRTNGVLVFIPRYVVSHTVVVKKS